MPEIFDILIVGGGINGCGIARDAAGRGHSVFLAEMDDLASGTSSRSSKLIHGGFRYLEHYEFRLVRESLNEREVLLRSAPHVIRPLRFVLPHHKTMRPAWLLRLGLLIYDHIGHRKLLPGTTVLDLQKDAVGEPLRSQFTRGFEYSDCWVDDSRLVALNARDATEKGAIVQTRTKVLSTSSTDGIWTIEMEDRLSGRKMERRARMLINAAGPWVDHLLDEAVTGHKSNNVRLIKGSHIVVPRIHAHDRAYIFQNADGRIVFVIPYESRFTLIGTTDVDYEGDPSNCAISPEEKVYLCDTASEYFDEPVRLEDIVWTYSGVRPLYDDGASAAQEATRDYVIRKDSTKDKAPLINVFGGKITTYRKLAEQVLQEVEKSIGAKGKSWTAEAALPGGDFAGEELDGLTGKILERYEFLPREHASRLARAYGTLVWEILGDARRPNDMGTDFGHSLRGCEVEYLMQHELALTSEDVLWRRSKLGLDFSRVQSAALDIWMTKRHAPDRVPPALSGDAQDPGIQ